MQDKESATILVSSEFAAKLSESQRFLIRAVESNDGRMFTAHHGSTDADLNFAVSDEGLNLLLIASAKGYNEMIDLMFQNEGLNSNLTDRYGVNAFWIASFYGHTQTMQKLMDYGVNIYATNQNGSNALHMAVKRSNM